MFACTTILHRFCFGLALSAAAIACGDQTANGAPIIDSVDAPLVVNAQNGMYTIPVTVLFHDNDSEAVTRLHYRLPPNVDGIIDVVAPNPDRESADLVIQIPVSALDATNATGPDSHDSTDNAPSADAHIGRGNDDASSGRGHAHALQLSIFDNRGAESVAQSSSVTLN
jgi:hypothetical protein